MKEIKTQSSFADKKHRENKKTQTEYNDQIIYGLSEARKEGTMTKQFFLVEGIERITQTPQR